MTEPINLTQLREQIADRAIPDLDYRIDPPTLLALIDTAEAAIALMNRPVFGWQDRPTVRLRETLNHYTT